MKKYKIAYSNIIQIMMSLIFLWSLKPFFTWKTYANGIFAKVNFIFLIITLFCIFTYKKIKISKISGILLLLTFIAGIIIIGICGGFHPTKLLSTAWIPYCYIFVYFLLNDEDKKNSFELFSKLLAILLIPSIFYFFITKFITLPYGIIESTNEIKIISSAYYRHYPFAVQFSSNIPAYDVLYSLRMCGMFDEAGALGTNCALILVANRFEIKNWYNKVLLTAGVLSFSLAFFMLVAIYFIVINLFNVKKKSAASLAFVSILYFIFINVPIHMEQLAKIQDRIQITSNGLAGDNRTNPAYDRLFDSFLNSQSTSDKLLGMGEGAIGSVQQEELIDGSSYKSVIYDYGYLGFSVGIAWIIITAIIIGKTRKVHIMHIVALIVVFLANLYQRPSLFYFGYIMTFLGGLYYEKNDRDGMKKLKC